MPLRAVRGTYFRTDLKPIWRVKTHFLLLGLLLRLDQLFNRYDPRCNTRVVLSTARFEPPFCNTGDGDWMLGLGMDPPQRATRGEKHCLRPPLEGSAWITRMRGFGEFSLVATQIGPSSSTVCGALSDCESLNINSGFFSPSAKSSLRFADPLA